MVVASELLISKPMAMAMDVEGVLHMKDGLGETSYAQNSALQKKTTDMLKHMIIDSAVDAYLKGAPKSMAIADLGCSSGPNTLALVADIVIGIFESCHRASQPTPEFLVFLNDLPTNDFNTLFVSFPEFTRKLGNGSGSPPVFLNGVPGSFYGRLFPSSSLHFIFSCYSLHWLSQVPVGLFDHSGTAINKSKLYISESSPPTVATAYLDQFQKDFNNFLRSRSVELVSGGRMVLTMLGRKHHHHDRNATFLWDLLAQSFAKLVSEKMVEEEKVDSYNAPYYAPSLNEIEDEVYKEGTFTIDHAEAYEFHTSTGDPKKDGRNLSLAIRAIQESMISHHFGGEIIDTLFQNYCALLTEFMEKEVVNGVHLIVVLKKLN